MKGITNGMDDGSLSQIETYEGTTRDPLIKIEERDLHSKTNALKLMRENGVFFPALGVRMKRDKQVVLEAIKSHPYTIMDLPAAVRKDPDVQRTYQESLAKKTGGIFQKRKLTDEAKRILILMEETEREHLMALELPKKKVERPTVTTKKPSREQPRLQRPVSQDYSLDDLFDMTGSGIEPGKSLSDLSNQ